MTSKKRPLRVVAIEDHDDGRELLEQILLNGGHEVWPAKDGTTGLSLVDQHSPDIVIVDMGLPDVHGTEVARRVKADKPGTCIIAMTGRGLDSDKAAAAKAGFDFYLVKPVAFESLEAILRDCANKLTGP